jgi:hypothetical protein
VTPLLLALAWSRPAAARFGANRSRPRRLGSIRGENVINAGAVDRAARILAGLGILSLTMFGPRSLLGLLGGAPLVTGLLGFCPIYELAGIRTCPARGAAEEELP